MCKVRCHRNYLPRKQARNQLETPGGWRVFWESFMSNIFFQGGAKALPPPLVTVLLGSCQFISKECLACVVRITASNITHAPDQSPTRRRSAIDFQFLIRLSIFILCIFVSCTGTRERVCIRRNQWNDRFYCHVNKIRGHEWEGKSRSAPGFAPVRIWLRTLIT